MQPTAAEVELQTKARHFAQERLAERATGADTDGRFDREVVWELGAAGLLDERTTAIGFALICEEIGRVDGSVRGFVTVQVGLVARCIARAGSAEQRDQWLPRLRSGEAIGCYALTEPGAGSDMRAITTRATREGDRWVLSGAKHFITNGGVADVGIVFASTEEGITAFLVPMDAQGIERRSLGVEMMGHRSSDHCSLQFDNVRLGDSTVIGEVGQGAAVASAALNDGRLGVAAGAVGILQACLDSSLDVARSRRQFGQRIGDFGMIQSTLADMAADLAASRLLVREAARLRDAEGDADQAVAIAKLFCVEAALRGADQAILLHGARGYTNEFAVERHWRDAKGMQIYEGTSHIQRIIIARRLLGKDRT